MKKMVIAAGLAAALMGAATSAPAAPGLDPGVYAPARDAVHVTDVRVRSHVCVARSPTAIGYGTSTSLAAAKRIALVQCALRTPRGMACFIRTCS